jgi:hypothetical protein
VRRTNLPSRMKQPWRNCSKSFSDNLLFLVFPSGSSSRGSGEDRFAFMKASMAGLWKI